LREYVLCESENQRIFVVNMIRRKLHWRHFAHLSSR